MSHKDSCMAEMAIHTHSFGIVSRRCEEGKLDAALQAMDLIVQQGTPITVDILYRLLHVCIQKKDLGGGRRLHCLIKKVRFESNSFLGSHLIRMFAICGSLIEAVEVFRKIPKRSVFTWNAVISANTNLGQPKHAIDLYHEMCQSEVKPNGHVFVAIVRACANAGALKQGMMVHVQICEHDLVSDLYLGSSLVDMYAKCGSLEEAWAIFDSWPTRNIVIWNAMIAGYAQHGCTHAAVQLFEVMKLNGVEPNAVTWNTLISGHIQEGHVKEAFQLSQQMQSEGVEPNIVTWNSIFAGYVQHGQGQEALECFQQMQQGGFTPNSITFLSALKACSIVASLEEGQKIHTCIIADGSESNNSVGNALVDMYSKCGCLERAHKVFERLSDKSVVTWSTMIAAYTQHGHSQEALKLFCQMQQEGIEPITVTWNAIIAGHAQHGLEKEAIRLFRQMQVEGFEPDVATFRSILKACSCIAALDSGKLIHAQVIGTEFEWDVPIGNTLIALYAKCGNLKVAQTVFSRLPTRNVVSWNSMIAGYALHNEYNLALQCLEAMQQEDVKPDDLTFVSLLAACGHLGLLDKGSHHFKSMIEEHGISLRPAHYNCMVDLLGRLGCLNEAADLLHIMPLTSNATGWKSLLSNCKTYGDLALGSHCFDSLVGMDCRHATGYMHMSSMYVDAERSNSAQDIQELRKCAYAWKVPGRAHIELDNQVHDFTVGEREHPEIDEVCAKLKKLTDYLKEDGHVPLLDLMLQTSADRAP